MHDRYLELAKEAAICAGEYLSKRQNIHVDENLERDIKLSSDKDSEKIILDCLASSGLPVLSEECGLIGSIEGLCWIADPLDGTVNYYKGLDELCCVSIALFDGSKPVLGVINRFAAGEIYSGIVGCHAACNDTPIKPSGTRLLRDSVLAMGFPGGTNYSDANLLSIVRRVQKVKKIRMLGSAALMAVFVACGRIDAYFEQDIRLWDVAAAMAIAEAAGGATRLMLSENDFKCDFGAFATDSLMEAFYGI